MKSYLKKPRITQLVCSFQRRERRKIKDSDDVKKGFEEVREIKRKYMLEKLGEHHKLIYEIIKKSWNNLQRVSFIV